MTNNLLSQSKHQSVSNVLYLHTYCGCRTAGLFTRTVVGQSPTPDLKYDYMQSQCVFIPANRDFKNFAHYLDFFWLQSLVVVV